MIVEFLQSPYQNARDARFPLRAIVNHRIVGTLPSARRAFGLVVGDPGRSASSHFGIGFVDGVLKLDQYVPLDRMAWTNGDVRDPTWAFYQAGVNPNLTTVTIEHEDGGYTGGVVAEPVWQASMELQRLLVSGDGAAIRAAGIRGATDAIVAQMAAITRDTRGFIDHHQIAGPNKPYCWRRWLSDPGFVEGGPSRRDRLITHVQGEGDMATPMHYQPVEWNVPNGTPFWTGGPGTGEKKFFVGDQVLDSAIRSNDGLWIVMRIGVPGTNSEAVWVRRADISPTVPGGDLSYKAAVLKVIEQGAAALASEAPAPVGITEEQAKKREAAARAGGVKDAATAAAATK